MSNPYVVTDDLSLVAEKLPEKMRPSQNRLSEASDRVSASLRRIFPDVEIIPGNEIIDFLSRSVSEANLPVISMTDLCILDVNLAFSRSVKKQGNSYRSIGYMPRNKVERPIKEQYEDTVKRIKGDTAIVEDVVFSGGTIISASEMLGKKGLKIIKVFCSVAIQDGVDRLAQAGIEVIADRIYPSVHDEVCARDFIVGMPGGGRNVVSKNLFSGMSYASAPYFYPFGDPQKWASIPADRCTEFSRNMLEISRDMWKAVPSGVKFSDLPKPVIGMSGNQSIPERLDRMIQQGAYDAPIARAS